jgi:glutathione S-transferase
MPQLATQPWRFTVKLIGIFLSPYVRRVAISLNLLNLPFEEDQVFVFGEPDIVPRYNPLVRIPALVLDDGTNLVESGAILDEIDPKRSSAFANASTSQGIVVSKVDHPERRNRF